MSDQDNLDRRSGLDRRASTGEKMTGWRGWAGEDVRMTRGFMLAAIVVIFCFVGFATYAAIHTVNSLRHDDCVSTNARRGEAADVAHKDVEADRAIWLSFDELIPTGIPEPTRGLIFTGLEERDAFIDLVYRPAPCP